MTVEERIHHLEGVFQKFRISGSGGVEVSGNLDHGYAINAKAGVSDSGASSGGPPPPALNQLQIDFAEVSICTDCFNLIDNPEPAYVYLAPMRPLASYFKVDDPDGNVNGVDNFPTESPPNEWINPTAYGFRFRIYNSTLDCEEPPSSVSDLSISLDITFSGGIWTIYAPCHVSGDPTDIPFFSGSASGIDPYTTGSIIIPNDIIDCSGSLGFGGTATITFTTF